MHYDHFDMEAFQAYPDKTVPMVVKRDRGRMARLTRKAGFTTIVELEPWESTMLGPIKVTAAPAEHSAPEITYLLEAHGLTVYFGADTLLIPELREMPARFPHIDVALLPVNGLEIRPAFNRKVVMDAREAAELCAILRPLYAVPIHYTFTAGPQRDRLLLAARRQRRCTSWRPVSRSSCKRPLHSTARPRQPVLWLPPADPTWHRTSCPATLLPTISSGPRGGPHAGSLRDNALCVVWCPSNAVPSSYPGSSSKGTLTSSHGRKVEG